MIATIYLIIIWGALVAFLILSLALTLIGLSRAPYFDPKYKFFKTVSVITYLKSKTNTMKYIRIIYNDKLAMIIKIKDIQSIEDNTLNLKSTCKEYLVVRRGVKEIAPYIPFIDITNTSIYFHENI